MHHEDDTNPSIAQFSHEKVYGKEDVHVEQKLIIIKIKLK